ncbi:hypothetical protein JTB14_002838 [Gonioctena quinquepunctata]|nr:hypothetical protein JTB14_002838 [Gonioctena quinquepunctata]
MVVRSEDVINFVRKVLRVFLTLKDCRVGNSYHPERTGPSPRNTVSSNPKERPSPKTDCNPPTSEIPDPVPVDLQAILLYNNFKMPEKTSPLLVISYTLLVFFCTNVESGPMKRLSRMVREVYPAIETENEGNQVQVCIVGDVVYGMDETVPAEQPCLKCKCQPPGVQCETIQCVKRPGCRAIHKTNKCCPDYQCECEHNGKFYANGEKLETPPGGECKVCYCRGGEVQCAEVSCYIRNDCEGKSVPGTCCPKYDNCPPIDHLIPERSFVTTELILPKPSKDHYDTWTITGLPNVTQVSMDSNNDFPDENRIPDTHYHEATTSIIKSLEVEDLEKNSPKITIQEIIPERKEIPITAPPRVITEPQGTLIIEEAEDFLNHSTNCDKLLFLKKGEFVSEKDTSTPNSVITIIGAEGLQRGFEDSGEVHEVKIDHPYGEDNHTETTAGDTERTLESADSKDLNLLVLNTAASTHILSLVKRKNKPTTTEVPPLLTESINSADGLGAEVSSTVFSQDDQEIPSKISARIDDQQLTTTDTQKSLTTEGSGKVAATETSKEKTTPSTITPRDQHDIIAELNPAYPPLSEILSPNMDDTSQRFDVDEKEPAENQKTMPNNITHTDWLKGNTETLVNLRASLPEELLNQPAPTDYEDNENGTVVPDKTEIPTEIFVNTEVPSNTESSTETTTVHSEPTIDSKEDIVEVTEKVINSPSVETVRSVESVEEIGADSGEATTPKYSHAPILSDENASVESDTKRSEADDMVGAKEAPQPPDEGNIEKTTPHEAHMIDNVDESKKQTDVKITDVEIIDTTSLQKPSIEKTVSSTSTPGFLLKPDTPDTHLKIIKREYSEKDYRDDGGDSDEDGEEKMDEEIFKQLLEDTSTPKIPRQSFNKESGSRQSSSNTLAQLKLNDAISDPNIGLLLNFFSNDRQ